MKTKTKGEKPPFSRLAGVQEALWMPHRQGHVYAGTAGGVRTSPKAWTGASVSQKLRGYGLRDYEPRTRALDLGLWTLDCELVPAAASNEGQNCQRQQ